MTLLSQLAFWTVVEEELDNKAWNTFCKCKVAVHDFGKQHNPRLSFVYCTLALLYKTHTQQNNGGILNPTQ